ncbi:MAG: proteasome-activating nucleotidase, partial [Thermoplasmata archaeon]
MGDGERLDENDLKDLSHYLTDRITALEIKNSQLAEDARRAENERKYVESELLRLQKEIKRLKLELERLKTPPLIVGYIRDVLSDGRLMIRSSTGPDFIVFAAEYIEKKSLIAGARVALNKQTLSIMGVLPPSKDPIVIGAEIIEKPNVSYEDIGGLEEQIREVREAVEYPLTQPELYRKVG